jgi:3',5'-cyclic AMP phosphodiesterase CpdA
MKDLGSAMGRLDFLKFMGFGGLVAASGLKGFAGAAEPGPGRDFTFAQLSDTHLGFQGPKINPDSAATLDKAVDALNGLAVQPDFVMFTGDLTHDTPDPQERRARMRRFKAAVARLKVQQLRFLPGEHDVGEDGGEAYREVFGPPSYAFEHKGIHFIALDNVTQPGSTLGPAQLDWLAGDLRQVRPQMPVVVFAHRPLFSLYEDWDWFTADGEQAIALLSSHPNVTVFYGHIHQEHHHMTGNIGHHAARSLIFPLPAPGSAPKRAPVPWDPAAPYRGLGLREVDVRTGRGPDGNLEVRELLHEFPLQGS